MYVISFLILVFSLNSQATFSGKVDPRSPDPSARARHMYNATGAMYGATKFIDSNGEENSWSHRHTAFICENKNLVCGSFHTFCDGKSTKVQLDNYSFLGQWENPKDTGIPIDLSRSWFGKTNPSGQKIYGVCPVNTDGKVPVMLRLTRPVTSKYPYIKPLKLKVLDTSRLHFSKDMSKTQKQKVINYYKQINENLVSVGFHDESTTDIPEDVQQKDPNIKYVQEFGVELTPMVPLDRLKEDFLKPTLWDTILFSSGYFAPESSGSPVGPCDDRGQCVITAIHGGNVSSTCWDFYESTSTKIWNCLNIHQAISQPFYNGVMDEIKRINSGR